MPRAEREIRVAAAGGRLVGLEDAAFGALAASASPDFIERLRAEGAWLVIDGRPLAAFCGTDT